MIEYNEMFRVDSLEELTQEHFSMACIAAMADKEELKGLLGVPCSASEFVLYEGPGESFVEVRNWSHMLSLHIVSKSGRWLVSSHIDGMGVRQVIGEAYRQFEQAKKFIKKDCKRAFRDVEITEGKKGRWLEGLEPDLERVREYLENKDIEDKEV